jgi:hypothetical protein
MRGDLSRRCDVHWPADWAAWLYTYRKEEEIAEIAERVTGLLSGLPDSNGDSNRSG